MGALVNLLPQVTPPPDRVRLKLESRDLDLVMHEYDAIRGEVLTTLTNQVSTLSFGAATVGLLVAAAAALWDDAELLSGLLLLFAVPSVCFLTLAIYSGELVRLMRAGLFLNRLENSVNAVEWSNQEPVLTWEQWKSIRTRPSDVDRLNRAAIVCVFVLLAVGFMTMGWWRLHTIKQVQPVWMTVFLIFSGLAAIVSVVWVGYLNIYAYRHRGHYLYPAQETNTAVLWDVEGLANVVGEGNAEQIAANPRLVAVTVYSPKSLEIHVPGVVETKVGNRESTYRYRYDGLRLVQRLGDRYLLMSEWDAQTRRIIVLRDTDDIRMEFTR
jgi:hypothetical protein